MTTMFPDDDEKATYSTCPRCGEEKLRTDRPALNALSRADNETYVCSDCGLDEGLQDFARGMARQSKEDWKAPNAATLKAGS